MCGLPTLLCEPFRLQDMQMYSDDWFLVSILVLALSVAIIAWRDAAKDRDHIKDNWYDLSERARQLEVFYFSVTNEWPQFDQRKKLVFDYSKDKGNFVAPAINRQTSGEPREGEGS
jgi:hypothetical protein